jgi:serine/threonine protein kinase
MPRAETRLSELIARWEQHRHEGRSVAVEDLCSTCPELAEELRRRIKDLEALDRVLTTAGDDASNQAPGRPQSGVRDEPVIADFEILGELGHGGMGMVYRAFDRKRGEIVALKTMHHISPSALYRFKQEFRALADVAHPNLVSLHQLSSDGQRWFFTMELVEGADFLDFVRSGPSRAGGFEQDCRPTDEAPTAGPGRDTTPYPPASGASSHEASDSAGLSPRQLGRLRESLKQLAAGVAALHEAGKLHRDIKPRNVLVTERGRVVLLDFGLAAELEPSGVHQSTEAHVLGTASYMSPEQAAGLPVSPASDWYSVGVILYESLTGRLPFHGQKLEVLRDKQGTEPPAPRELVPTVPEDLDALCVELLQRSPEARPSGPAVLARLGVGSAGGEGMAPSPAAPCRQAPFVGRDRHLEALHDALAAVKRGRTMALLVRGRSGVGKSALVEHFLDDLSERDEAVVLEGRCYERESVPYKALDSAVDALARYLRRLPGHEAQALLPRDILSLARVFPVLRRVDAVAEAPQRSFEVPDPPELRRRAFAALRELLARLGDRRPLVLSIDDLQWGDADSAALLAELLRPPDPPVLLLLAAYRSEDATASPVLRGLAAIGQGEGTTVERRDLAVEALALHEAETLAAGLLDPGDPAREAHAAVIARESGGNPFFVAELVRHLQGGTGAGADLVLGEEITLDRVLRARIQRLPEGIRRLLEVIAVAGRPIGPSEACRAAEIDGDGRAAQSTLAAWRLVRSTGPTDQDAIETYHDRVRETVVAQLARGTLVGHHHHLAQVLEISGKADPEVLAAHYDGAGEPEKAGAYYATAAGQAAKSLAFDRAVKLFQRTLELRSGAAGGEYRIRADLGDALANAGRGAEAAAQYLLAADVSPPGESLDLRRKAATQLLTSGNIDEGLGVLDVVLRSVGMRLPTSDLGAVLSMLLGRVRVLVRGLHFRERSGRQLTPDEVRKTDICWSIATGLGVVDFVRGFDFQTRHLLLSLRTGEPRLVAKALAWEGAHSSVAGEYKKERTAQIFRTCEQLCERIDDHYTAAFLRMTRGCAAYLEGRWTAAHRDLCDAEERFANDCTGVTWELDTTRTFSLWSLLYLGSIAELGRRLPILRREADERGDLYFLMNLSTYLMSFVMAGIDEPTAGREALSEVARRWSQRGFHIQHHNVLLGTVLLDLYEGNGHSARNYIAERWSAYRKSLLLQVQQVRVDVDQLWARSALAIATKSTDQNRFFHEAERRARRLERERVPWAMAHAQCIRAGIAAGRGDRTKAHALVTAAARGYEAADMRLYAAAARRRSGELLGGDEGRARIAAADRWMTDQGVRRPTRITAMYAPGFPDQE